MFFKHKKVKSDKTLGEKLQTLRKRKGYNLEDAENATKVSVKYLSALEVGDYENLPADIYVVGFLKKYCEFLGADGIKYLQYYHEEKNLHIQLSKKMGKITGSDLIRPNLSDKWSNTPKVVITPKVLISTLAILMVVVVMGYIFYQVKSFAAAPPLEIAGQFANMKVKVNEVTIEGQTDAAANLSINNQPVSVSPDGHFSQEVKLISGINEIEVIAKNKTNKLTKQTIKILAEY